jgi:simple sugar transport system ATP-binding protein/ribose transport system ATP-binding protein
LSETARVGDLGMADRQIVEIARALARGGRIIAFDEPTSSLTPAERDGLFAIIRGLKRAGKAIIYISHRMAEIREISDRVTVLRDGKLVSTGPAAGLDRAQIVRMMVGRDISASHYAAVESGQAATPAPERPKDRRRVLSVENVTMGSVVKNMSFSVYAGEVVGIAGLVGSGRTEVAHIICGARKRNFLRGGHIYLNDKPIRYRVPRQAVHDGIVYITEDRKLDGFFETMTADDNVYLGYLASPKGKRWLYSFKERKAVGDRWTKALAISALKRSLKIIEYSGGNQQKLVVAKSLAQEPSVVIFDEPTRGVDVGAIPQIHAAIRALAAEGKAVIVISSYLPEVLAISDRILVARGGRIVEEIPASEATEEKIMYAAIH